MINRIIDEINVCLNSNCFIAALTTALVLPDICGKAELADKDNRKVKKRYVSWFDNYIGKYEKSSCEGCLNPYINGNLIFDLRNNILHAGNFNIDEKTQNIQDFELLVESPTGAKMNSSMSSVQIHYINGNEVVGDKYLCINVLDLIYKLCACAKHYYNNNKEKFDFINNKITTMERFTKRMLHISEEEIKYENFYQLDKSKTKSKWEKLYE